MSHLIRGSERMYSCNKSSIYRGVWDGHDIAIKHIPRRFCVMDNMGKSVESKFLQVMQDCNRVVRHIDTIYEEDDIYIVMDWVRGRDMRRHMQMMTGPLSEIRVRDIVFQVAIFLKACNRKGLVYADTKLENIMIEPTGGTKIIDFGCTRSIHNAPMCYMGTPLYFSPEMFDMVLSPSHDVWGLGVVAYYIACGNHPFLMGASSLTKDISLIRSSILGSPLHFQQRVWLEWSEDGKDLIKGMLQKDPVMRLTMDEVLSHPWFSVYH